MSHSLSTRKFALLVVVLLPLLVAADPAQQRGGGRGMNTAFESSAAIIDSNLAQVLKVGGRPNYVSAGTGMRNRGYGEITISGIPAGSQIVRAYLYWAVINSAQTAKLAKGKFNGIDIVGTYLGQGAGPCWSALVDVPPDPIFGYRADVTWLVPGNGVYQLSKFASAVKNGSEPEDHYALPSAEGASLVVVYKNDSLPKGRVQIYQGISTNQTFQQQTVDLRLVLRKFLHKNPIALTRTTFIGADGQRYKEPDTTLKGASISEADWDGTDLQAGSSFANGNLWDTDTAVVSRRPGSNNILIRPFDENLEIIVKSKRDCFTWLAQVLYSRNGAEDLDGDNLKNGWEDTGYDHNNNGAVDVDLPSYGADVRHKDAYIEADYMTGGGHDHLMDLSHLNDAIAVFNDAPVSNIDGTTGIHLHIDTGGAAFGALPNTHPSFDMNGGNGVPHDDNLGGADASCLVYDWNEFQAYKNANFAPARTPIFHYMIFAHGLAPCFGLTSGYSRNNTMSDAAFIQGATDFVVSLGLWTGFGSQDEREGTFIHEFGHNLGLRHGGNDHLNHKANYMSVMNYFWQTTGVWRDNSQQHFDYSRFVVNTLNESALNEQSGLGAIAANYGTAWYCPNHTIKFDTVASSNLDYNCDLDGGTDTNVAVDLNWTNTLDVLGTSNDWASITFGGGGIIGAGLRELESFTPLMQTDRVDELTFEENQRIQAEMKR